MKSRKILSLALALTVVISAAVAAPPEAAAVNYPEAFEAYDASLAPFTIGFPEGYEESGVMSAFEVGGQFYWAYVLGIEPFIEHKSDGMLWGRSLNPELTLYKIEAGDGAWYWEFPDHVVAIVDNSFFGTTITIPATVFGKPVTKVYSTRAYNYNQYNYYQDPNLTVTAVTLPDSVKYIGPGAFNGMRNLKSIKLPNNPNGLTVCAPFLSSDVIESVEFPCDVLLESRGYQWSPMVTQDSGYLFEFCYNLSNITFSGGSVVVPYGQLVDMGHSRDGKTPRQVTEDDPFTITFKSGNPPVKFYRTDSSSIISTFVQTESEMFLDGTYAASLGGFGIAGIWSTELNYKVVVPRDCRKNYLEANDGDKTDAYYFGLYVSEAGEYTVKPATPLDTASDWARDYITRAIDRGIIPDDLQDNYTQYITRGEFCRMAVQYIEAKTTQSVDALIVSKNLAIQPGVFTDTSDPSILAANALGIVTGSGNNLFNPGGDITREEAAIMLMRLQAALAQDTAGAPAGFADSSGISSWAVDGVNYVSTKGIMSGVGNNLFDPQGKYTREQAVTTFVRLYELPYAEYDFNAPVITGSGENPLVYASPVPMASDDGTGQIVGIAGLQLAFSGHKPSFDESKISDIVLYVNGVKRDVGLFLDDYSFYSEEEGVTWFIFSLDSIIFEKPASYRFTFLYDGVQQESDLLEVQ